MEVVKRIDIFKQKECHNLSIGFATKAKTWKCVGQKCNPRVTFALPGEGEGVCEGMNPHTPKWIPILGVGVSIES